MRNKQYIQPSIRVAEMALVNMILSGSTTDDNTLSFSPKTGKQW